MSKLLLVLVSLWFLPLGLASTSDVEAQLNPVGMTEARFVGTVTIDGSPAGRLTADRTAIYVEVEALVNGKVCSSPQLRPPGRPPNFFHISVDSEAIIPGCAKPGDRITFRVDGRPANEIAVWQPQSMQSLDLTVGTAASQGRPPVNVFQPPSTGGGGLR